LNGPDGLGRRNVDREGNVSDLQVVSGLAESERHKSAPPLRRRRFARLPVTGSSPAAITEGAARRQIDVRDGLYRRALAVADALAAMTALVVVFSWDARAGLSLWALAAVPAVVVVNKITRLYDRDELVLKKTTLDEAPTLLQIAGLFALLTFLVQDLLVAVEMTPPVVLKLWIATFAALLLGRTCARHFAARAVTLERCLVLGDTPTIAAVRSKLDGAGLNAQVVAAVRLEPDSPRIDADSLRGMVRDHEIHRVIFAPITTDARDTLDLIRVAKALGVRVSVLPRLFEVVGSAVEFDHVDGLTMLGVRRFGLTRSSRAVKRAFDFVGSSLALLAVAPLLGAIGLAVRLDSRGSILFRQTRVGRDGKRFEILKFRTMVPDAERMKGNLVHLNETQGLFKIAQDPRVTRVGGFLRRTALDELPQLLNVWRGEMSLVGPRPLVVDEDAKIEGLDRSRLHLTPGMTGHWQILGSARVPLNEMVGIDYLYVANWSLWTDVKILLRTIPYVFARRGM
jgi:exopolysaccharide biosynthesis polyprenyl glycosylphosphotransferase